MNIDTDTDQSRAEDAGESGPPSPLAQEIERCVHLAAVHELDLGTTWADRRVQSFAERIARRAASLLVAGRTAPALTADAVRAVVREVFARVTSLSGATFAQRTIEDIATRVAQKLTGRWFVVLTRADARSIRDAFEDGFHVGVDRGHDTAEVRLVKTTHDLVREDLATRERALQAHLAERAEPPTDALTGDDAVRFAVEREMTEAADRATEVDDRSPYDRAFAARVAARVAERLVDRRIVAVTPASEVRQVVRAAVMAGTPDGASSLSILERSLDADVTATRVYDRLSGQPLATPTPRLRPDERAILCRLRDNEARARSSIGHLGEDVQRTCDEAVALLERLIGPEAP